MSDKCNCYRFSPRDSLSGAVAQIANYLSKHPGWNETELRAFVDGLISPTGVESFNGRTGAVNLDKNDVNNLKIASAYFAEGDESIDSLDIVSLYNQGVRFVFTDFNSVTHGYNLVFALEYFSGSGNVVYYPMSTVSGVGGNIVSVNGKTGEVRLKVVDVSNGNSPDENAYIFIDESDDYPEVISPDSNKLGGQLPSYYASAEEVSQLKNDKLGKTETAADSAKLGGKAPEYYLQPRNLLDNSDFRNPVNQRGLTNYTTAHSYGIDRWKVGDVGTMLLTTDGPDGRNVAFTGNGDINISYIYQRIPTTLKAGRTYTLATEFYFNNGVVALSSKATDLGEVEVASTSEPSGILLLTFTPSVDYTAEANNTYIRIQASGTVGLRWAALYEGAYTADTLPPYVPKGYAEEFVECRRYYKKTIHAVLYCYADSYLFPFIMEMPMHRVPTYVIVSAYTASWDGISGDITMNDVTDYGVGVFQNASFKAGNYYRLFIEVNADL